LKIILIWVGKTRNREIGSLLSEFQQRLRHFCELVVIEVKPAAEYQPLQSTQVEGERALARLQPEDFVIVLDPAGTELTTENFAGLISERRELSLKNLVFVAGGPYGVSSGLKRRSQRILSLSKMTLSHEMARLVLLEQLYRAFTLIHHIPYHK
jgi:23S rRNA (pseudouridine1915-N3)-methyltransferase